METKGTFIVLLASILSVPMAYFVNMIPGIDKNPAPIFIIGLLCLLVAFLIPAIAKFKQFVQNDDPLYYAMSILTFAAVIDLTIALENDNIVHSVMAFYFVSGEPYLKSGHGSGINYHDGILHFACYIIILLAIDNRKNYREVGLYWGGSIVNSLIVLMLGGAVGKHGARWSMLLNVIYMVVPIWITKKVLDKPPNIKEKSANENLLKRPFDIVTIVLLLSTMFIYIFKGLAALGCNSEVTQSFVNNSEPYLGDPIAFPKLQMMTYLFYCVPFCAFASYSLIHAPAKQWFLDWLFIYAGAVLNGQIPYMFASLHHLTPSKYRVPKTSEAQLQFWTQNLFLLIVPQILLVHYYFTNSKEGKRESRGTSQSPAKKSASRARGVNTGYNLRNRIVQNSE
ncbi:transmembrane 6 superfamily member 2-like [Saccostrea echinata]|uniref:transmembrane 6 superfamily member 2-like n=1 Tax=Saccostrea echinata TaxID=191078 RepID=UPI002A7F705B|nr:transmembrane 6 superfamily member 2-like [Saccostrea echinata]